MEEHSTEEAFLKAFLLDIDCLEALSPWTNKFNLFDVLKISRTEIRHSNMLAWLLDPKESHNLKDSILRALVEFIAKQREEEDFTVFELLLMNFYSFKVLREWKNIDILLISEEHSLLIAVENKVYSSEHDNQLARYKQTLQENYPQFRKFFLFLTPQGEQSSDMDTWLPISYGEILQFIENALEKASISGDVHLLIQNYVETVRCHLVGDQDLIKICNEIYKKHQKALDFIFEHKLDQAQEISNFLKEYLVSLEKQGEFTLHEKKCTKQYLRFTSNTLDKLLPQADSDSSGWNTKNYYFYEITNKNNCLKLQLSLSKGSLSQEEAQDYYGKLLYALEIPEKKKNWTWKTVKSWHILNYLPEQSLEELEDTLFKQMDAVFAQVGELEDTLWDELGDIG